MYSVDLACKEICVSKKPKMIIEGADDEAVEMAKDWGNNNGFDVAVNKDNELPAGSSKAPDTEDAGNLISLVGDQDTLSLSDVTKVTVERALRQTGGNIMATSKILGMGRATVYRKIRIYKIDKSLFRKDRLKIKKAA